VIACPSNEFGNAVWPSIAPLGAAVTASGVCDSGFVAGNGAPAPQRVCLAVGAYESVIINGCVRT
jgi:hypothetical protein